MKIRRKLIVYTLGVVLIVGALISLFSIYEGRRRILSSYEKECRGITHLLSRNIANDVYFLDVSDLTRHLENTRFNPDISSLLVTDLEGEVLSDGTLENPRRGQKLTDPFSRRIMKAQDWILEADKNLLKIGGPIRMSDGNSVGYLQASFNLSLPYGIVRTNTRTNLIVSIFCFALGALLAFFLSLSFTRPLKELVEATETVGRGNFDIRVRLQRKDEFGQLAESFNQMAEDLKKTLTERQRAEEGLRHSLQEKEVLLKEIHHRVKNNLQIITSLLRLQAGHADEPRITEILRESQNRIRSIAFIHEQLYLSQDFSQIDFGLYFHTLSHHLFQSYGVDPEKITLKTRIENLFLDIDLVIPLSIILHELISNALKHAFQGRDKGEIEIEFGLAQNEYHLAVRDNGIGLPADGETKRSTSLGLQLVSALVDQIQGRLQCLKNEGTTFQITFPKPLQ